jgi:hypothetical protein
MEGQVVAKLQTSRITLITAIGHRPLPECMIIPTLESRTHPAIGTLISHGLQDILGRRVRRATTECQVITSIPETQSFVAVVSSPL